MKPADEKKTFDEYTAIEHALQPYLDAARTGDGNRMIENWFDHAHVVGSLDGTLVNLDTRGFGQLINRIGGSPEVQARIASIDCQGRAASARIEFYNWGGVRYTDFFLLYKKDGSWTVSAKVYDSHTRN
ncbi:MAG: nuclear transport factor 2 family protein [Myxococcota bacterium]